MKALIFQHAETEAPGTLVPWLESKPLPYHVHHWYRGGAAPEARDFGWLIILGGAMNVDEEQNHPWLKDEKNFLRGWLASGKPVLGICLGAQLLAQCLGGAVGRNPQREIGFHEVFRNSEKHPALKSWPMRASVYQYHEDTIALPPGCTLLMNSPACALQAFALNSRTLGLQFHPESSAEWIRANAASIAKGAQEKYVQTPAQTDSLMAACLPSMTSAFHQLLDDFHGHLSQESRH